MSTGALAEPRVQEITVAEVMSRDLVTIDPESTLRDLLTLLAETGVSGVPVVDRDYVVGVVSARDLIEFESEAPAAAGEEEGWEEWEADDALSAFFLAEPAGAGVDAEPGGGAPDLLARQSVGEVMTRRLVTVAAHALLREAAARMQEAGVHRLLVLEEGRLAGIVTTSDVVRAVARYG
jgi:CBS domain-containing protein